MKIAWIGTGIMGAPMVSALINNKYELQVYNRSAAKAEVFSNQATVCYSIKEVVIDADIIFSIVSLPDDVRSIYLEDGIIAHAKAGAICVDMTTSSPSLAQEMATIAQQKSIAILDAPVSGGDIGAKNHTLSIMVGGDVNAYHQVLPLLQLMGKTIHHVGPAGYGQHTKLANQIAVAHNLLGTIESLHYAKTMNLQQDYVLKVLTQGAANSWQLANNGPLIMQEDYTPGFMNLHFIKDLKLIKEEAKKANVTLPIVNRIIELYLSIEDDAFLKESTIALYKHYINS